MKINALSKLRIVMALGMCLAAAVFAAEAAPPTATTPPAPVPANPFGPKPTEPVSTGGQAEAPTMTPDAQQARGGRGGRGGDAVTLTVREMLLERFDKNKDGKLDEGELAEARALFSGPRGRAGRDVTPQEAALAANGPLFGLRGMILRNLGKPPNASFDDADVAQLHTFLFGAKADAPKDDGTLAILREDILKQFDKNGDGKLEDAELTAARATLDKILADMGKSNVERIVSPKRPVPPPADAENNSTGVAAKP
jgi:hypothetical protein